jgi:microcystin-dependent protein
MNSLLPFGTVTAFSAGIDPTTLMAGALNFGAIRNNTGWLLCNGQPVFQSEFPGLFAAIGYTYGGSNGSFNVPDYRGYFLRGLAQDNSVDKGFDLRNPPAQGQKDGIGSTQPCMVQMHEHNYTDYPGTPATIGNDGPDASKVNAQSTYTKGLYTDDSGGTTLSGEETRPVNIYVNYIIFAGGDISRIATL